MPSSVRLLFSGAVGVVVCLMLASGAMAQTATPTAYPAGTAAAQTAQAGGGGSLPTATPTATGAAAATATGTTVPGAGAVAPNSATIANGRGRVANVRDRSFTLLWTTDGDAVAQVNYGTSASLGTTATDQRGPAFGGRTHYVEIGGLTPNTTYFFDLVSGGVVDNNAGQHYQIRTGPEIAGSAPLSNRLEGTVLLPGGVAPAAGALVWAVVKDANNQGTGGASQLLGALAQPDGRFIIALQPRTSDLAAYFVYSTEGDLIDVSARHEAGSVDMGLNTAVTQGGTTPNNVQLVLTAMSPAQVATATPTRTMTPMPGAAATFTPIGTPFPTPSPAPPTPVLAVPVQLPTLREMALSQPYPVPAQPGVVAPSTPAQAVQQPGYPGPAAPAQPAPVPKPQPAATSAPLLQPPPPAVPTTPVFQPGTTGPTAGPPGAQPGPTGPAPVAPGTQPIATVPPSFGTGGVPQTGIGGIGTQPPTVGSRPGGSFGQPAPRDTVLAPQPAGAATAVAPSPAPLAALANLPPIVSALFYGGILIVALGGGLAVWSVLNGSGWRPR